MPLNIPQWQVNITYYSTNPKSPNTISKSIVIRDLEIALNIGTNVYNNVTAQAKNHGKTFINEEPIADNNYGFFMLSGYNESSPRERIIITTKQILVNPSPQRAEEYLNIEI